MWALLLLPIVLLVLYFAQRLLFRRLWDENLTVQISFDRDYIFCGEEANLVETIVNNKYLSVPVLRSLRYEPLVVFRTKKTPPSAI